MAPLLKETAKAHKRLENEISVTELELKSLLLKKKREGRHLERAELNWFCRAIWRKRRALKREKQLTKIKVSVKTEKASQGNTKHTFQLEFDCETRKSRNSFHKISSKTSAQFLWTKKVLPNPRDSLDRALEKHENGLCWWNTDVNEETGESTEQTAKMGKGPPDQMTADVLTALHPECLEKLAGSLSVMCLDMNFPEEWLCSLTVMAPKEVGATCLTQFRPIAGLCAMRKVLGYECLSSH